MSPDGVVREIYILDESSADRLVASFDGAGVGYGN
jgi:hypothetical protein